MRISLAIILTLSISTVFSQEKFYAYLEDWSNTTNMKKARYFMHVVKEDTAYVCRYYNIYGPMIKMEAYSDEALTTPTGRFAWYNEKGKLDSTGFVFEGKKDKYWHYFTHPDSSNATVMEKYEKGKFQWRQDYLNKRTIYSDGRIVPFDTSTVNDTSKSIITVQVEASFPKGLTGWRKYLERNLKTPDRFMDIIKNGRATTVVSFTVDVDGTISDVHLDRSVEWSVDTEAQRVIKSGPKWEPATQNGRKVKYRQRQSITFVVQG